MDFRLTHFVIKCSSFSKRRTSRKMPNSYTVHTRGLQESYIYYFSLFSISYTFLVSHNKVEVCITINRFYNNALTTLNHPYSMSTSGIMGRLTAYELTPQLRYYFIQLCMRINTALDCCLIPRSAARSKDSKVEHHITQNSGSLVPMIVAAQHGLRH